MPLHTLTELERLVTRQDRRAAVALVRASVVDGRLAARDGIELMLAIWKGSAAEVGRALRAARSGLLAAYRYAPYSGHGVA
ncbi:MAG: hypothetical protein RLZZ15_305 [Verrucomicrobiota bacterium]|jgi:hypothetical protein